MVHSHGTENKNKQLQNRLSVCSVCLVTFTPEATDVIPLTLLINIARMCEHMFVHILYFGRIHIWYRTYMESKAKQSKAQQIHGYKMKYFHPTTSNEGKKQI